MPARTVSRYDADHDRKMLKRAVTPRLTALQDAYRQLENLASYNPDERDRDYVLAEARRMQRALEAKFAQVAATQLDMGLFTIG